MSKPNSYAETTNAWEALLKALEQNSVDLPQLEIPRQRLQTLLDQTKDFATEQAALTASRQIATSRVEYLLAQGRKLATVLRASVREHYGNRNEKIVEFGLQPLRTRRKAAESPLPQPE
jgi:hypothetical protein